MKRKKTNRSALPAYLLFCLLFGSAILLFLLLGASIRPTRKAAQAQPTETPSASGPVVIIDPGHGGEDGGTVGVNGVYEKDLNLAIAFCLRDALEEMGIRVVLTRTEDILLYDRNSDYQGKKKVQDLATRRRIAEEYENAVFVSIHMNAYPDGKYKGLQTWYSQNHPDSQSLASALQEAVKAELQTDNRRKIKAGNQTSYLLERLQCPALLVECGFLSNAEECEALCDENYQRNLASLMAKTLQNYFSAPR